MLSEGDNSDDENVYADEYYDSFDDENNDNFNEDSDGDLDGNDDPLLAAPWRPVVRWKQVRLGEAVLEVSSHGHVKPFGTGVTVGVPCSTEGVRLLGTPYRTYTVEVEPHHFKTYYMHELVYQAFNGPPPDGFEVRHVPEHTHKKRTVYANRLGCLTIVPKTVVPVKFGPLR